MRNPLLILLLVVLTALAFVAGRTADRPLRDPAAALAILLTAAAFVAAYLFAVET